MKASRGFFCLLELHQRKYMPHFFRCGLNLTAELFNLCNAADQVKCLDMFDFSLYLRIFVQRDPAVLLESSYIHRSVLFLKPISRQLSIT